MSVTITIKTASLVSELKVKSFMNTEHIKDSEDKYATRAGEEANAEIMQSLQDAWGALLFFCRKFLSKTTDTSGSDTYSTSTSDKTLTFDLTSRRTSHIAEPLAQAIHEYLVGGTLRRYYTTVSNDAIATRYAANEKEASLRITQLLYTKDDPTY